MMKAVSRTCTGHQKKRKHLVGILLCDAVILLLLEILILVLHPSSLVALSAGGIALQILLAMTCIFGMRFAFRLYNNVWRYGSSSLYLRMILIDAVAGGLYFTLQKLCFDDQLTFIRALSVVALNLLGTLASRLVYQFLYEFSSRNSPAANIIRKMLSKVIGLNIEPVRRKVNEDARPASRKINVAIVGAGRIGVMLADELLNNPLAAYTPCCFIDIDREKIGRYISGIRVFAEEEIDRTVLDSFPIQEIVFALPDMPIEHKKELYESYKTMGYKVKIYDFPTAETLENNKRHLREFDIEDLLFRKALQFTDDATRAYYSGKTVLISGGGGSIGGELCRQIAKMQPKRLVILDVYENGAYDVQQELKIAYGARLDVSVEIITICDREALEDVFERHHPDIVLHAAAHKHVPLMETSPNEAIKNNVFGTYNVANAAGTYGAEKFVLISTDKAVNPTNVMGASKRLCEMVVQSMQSYKNTTFVAVRFGNVLGSNGSVIPLFKRQLANGGPLTITDKRIIRYFMTIPEAAQLVMQAGAMAERCQVFVLDMGKPVKILDLAENLVRMAGLTPYVDVDIIETGLRPGEKLYEELLMNSDTLTATKYNKIFIEQQETISREEMDRNLARLREELETESPEKIIRLMREIVPTFKTPDEVNRVAANKLKDAE